jgi:hypothetical protein
MNQDNPYANAMRIADVADELVARIRNEGDTLDEYQKAQIVQSLVIAEEALDKSRSIVPAGSGIDYPDDKKEVERRLDKLRDDITEIVGSMDFEKVKVMLETLGNEIKTHFLTKAGNQRN